MHTKPSKHTERFSSWIRRAFGHVCMLYTCLYAHTGNSKRMHSQPDTAGNGMQVPAVSRKYHGASTCMMKAEEGWKESPDTQTCVTVVIATGCMIVDDVFSIPVVSILEFEDAYPRQRILVCIIDRIEPQLSSIQLSHAPQGSIR